MPLRIVLVASGFLAAAAELRAVPQQSLPVQPQEQEVRVLSANGSAVILAGRDRSGGAVEGQPPATVLLDASAGQIRFRVQAPRIGTERQFRLALIFWNGGAPPYPPPSVLYATAAADGVPTLSGRVFLGASDGDPRLVRSAGVWRSLGARAGTGGPVLELSVPLSTIGDLCPNGVLLDLRLQTSGALYSYGPAASWFEPPEPTRSLRLKWEPAGARSGSAGSPVRLLAASLGALPVQRGSQLWALSNKALPLDQGPCGGCAEAVRSRELVGQGEISELIGRLRQLASSLDSTDLGWQQAMLELQSTHLDTGRLDDSIEAGLQILEADGTWEGTVVRALRTLAAALMKAKVRLAGNDARAATLKSRFFKAVSDRNFRAAYGADLLMLQELFEDASVLLESVRASGFARPAVRAHAMYRLEQLSARTPDWRRALSLAEQIQVEVPFDIVLRGASLTLLSPSLTQTRATAGDLSMRLDELHANLKAGSQAACLRYFAAAPSCPVCVSKEE
jgi:hypothetical protein